MPASSPAARPVDPGTFARTTITTVMAVIAALAFVFSFGNVWTLALRLGVPHPVAPLIAPMVDLSVVGLLVAQHYLAATGTDPAQLRSATRLMHLCGLLTLALNTAEPLLAGRFGRAALDTVAPALLLGWGTVGPTLLRHLHNPTPAIMDPTDQSPSVPAPVTGLPVAEHGTEPEPEPEKAQPPTDSGAPPAERGPEPQPEAEPEPEPTQAAGDEQATPASTDDSPTEDNPAPPSKRTGRKPAASTDQLVAIARPAVAEHGASIDVVRKAVRGSGMQAANNRLGEVLQLLKNEQTAAELELALDHPAVD